MPPTQSNNQFIYTKLTSRINELLGGELKKLEFGCELKSENPSKYRRFYTGSNQEEEEVFFIDADQTGCEDQYWYREGEIEEHEIIGRDATLADVLRAIGSKYAVDGSGMILERQFGTSEYDCAGAPYWDLTKPLSGQSQEVIDFLGELLN